MLKLIIFDLDGTLIDAYLAITASFNYTMQALGYPKACASDIRKAVGWGDAQLLKPFIKNKDLLRALSIYRRDHRRSLLRGARLIPGARKVLSRLKRRGFKLAVASNRPTEFSRILIRHLRLEAYFDYMLCADKLRYGKPHPMILQKIMRKFAVRPQEALYIGDMTVDAQAGRRAKVKTIIVTGGSSTMRQIKKERPYRVMGRIEELLKIVQ